MTFGGPDDSIEKGDTVMLSLDFPSVLRVRWVATSQAFLPETKHETKLKDRARNCYNNDCCFFNGIKQVGLQKSRDEISQKIITYQVLEVPSPVTTSVKLYRRCKLIFIRIFSLFFAFFALNFSRRFDLEIFAS
jgi:hypothetical protein